MKQFYKKFNLLVFLLLASTLTFAQTFVVDGIKYNVLTGTTNVEVVANSPLYSGDIVIPSTVTNASITYTVKSIGEKAFSYCTNLKNATIPSTVTSIGNMAFRNCQGLNNINIPNSITDIGYEAFYYCLSLKSIIIPNQIINIGFNAFSNCTSLISITIPNTIKIIERGTFENCSLISSIVIPSSVTSIGTSSFSNCTNLKTVIIPISVTNIGTGAFSGCTSLTDLTIPSSVTIIGGGSFADCTTLTNIIIPNSITSIEGSTFSNCISLKKINLPNSITSIGEYAFAYCSNLEYFTIPNSVTYIGNNAFISCIGLKRIIAKSNTPFTFINSFPNIYTKSILYVPLGFKSDYQKTYGWNLFTTIVEYTNFNNILYNITNSTTVEIANNEEIITGNINIPSTIIIDNKTYTVTKISENAFLNCTGLTSITIPNSVTSIGNGAFKGCTSLTSIKLEANSPITITSSVFERVANKNEIFAASIYTTATLYVPAGSKTAYQNDAVWGKFANIVEYSVTGTEALNSLEANVNIFPNPASDNITISLNESISGIVSIIDSKGNVVLTKAIAGNTSNISTNDLTSDVYVVKISTEKGVVVKQLVVR